MCWFAFLIGFVLNMYIFKTCLEQNHVYLYLITGNTYCVLFYSVWILIRLVKVREAKTIKVYLVQHRLDVRHI